MAAAGFGLNSMHANMRDDRLNHARWQEPDSGSLIACRICDRVFASSKALFDHIELHLSLDESTARRQLLLSHLLLTSSSQRSQRLIQNSPPLLAAGISTRQQVLQQQPSLSSTLRNPFSLGTNTRNLGLQPAAPSPASFRPSWNKLLLRPRPTLQVSAAPQTIMTPLPQPRTDCFTRPFLNQLEANLLIDGMASLMDREIAAGKLGDQQMLDVTLKLGREEN